MTVPSTRVTLLIQLRQDPLDQAGWEEFVERYGQHIYRWDAEDKDFSADEPRPIQAWRFEGSPRDFGGA